MSTNERLRATVLGILKNAAEEGSTMAEIVYALGDDAPARKELRQLLKALSRTGEIVRVDRDLYAIAQSGQSFEGILEFRFGRFQVQAGQEKVELPATALGEAIAGDRVRGTMRSEGRTRIGAVEAVVDARAPRRFSVELSRFRGLFMGASKEVAEPVQLSGPVDAKPGETVQVEVIGRRLFKRGNAKGVPSHALTVRLAGRAPEEVEPSRPRVPKEQILRYVDDRETNARTILDQLASGLGADQPFEDVHEVQAGAGQAPKSADEVGDDLTGVPFATIDGSDAKDFDDAVYAEAGPGKTTRLWVAIADVSSYVEEGTELDEEARRRGCSVYLPGCVYPMLPFHLADDVCSLRPDELRRCAWVRMDIDSEGVVQSRELGFGVMKSRARMTYAEVQEILDGEATDRPAEIVESVKRLDALRACLYAKRTRRGMLDLHLPEPRVTLSLDGKRVEGLQMYPRFNAHRLIEECMLVTNETVADFLVETGWPGIYRVHGEPNRTKLQSIQRVLREVADGAAIPADPKPRDLVKVFDQVAGTPLARVVSWLVLRTLPRAEYSTDRRLHFGLGTDRYLHFTSPIRRYPDLEVHRMVRRALKAGRSANTGEREVLVTRMNESAALANNGESIQTTAERWSERMMRALYMAGNVGEEYDAMISDVARFGVFVSVEDPYVEGLVPIRSLGDEYFELDERRACLVGSRSSASYQIGDTLRVVCTAVDVKEGRINFEPVDTARATRKRKPKRGPKGTRGRQLSRKPHKKGGKR